MTQFKLEEEELRMGDSSPHWGTFVDSRKSFSHPQGVLQMVEHLNSLLQVVRALTDEERVLQHLLNLWKH